MHRTFEDAWNYSIILRGSGTLTWNNTPQKLQAPCVLRQWPGRTFSYGPAKNWDELFISFLPAAGATFLSQGFDNNQPHWPLKRQSPNAPLQGLIRQFIDSIQCPHRPEMDVLDRLAQQLVYELYAQQDHLRCTTQDHKLDEILNTMSVRPNAAYDIPQLSLQLGWSPSHFRRQWKQRFGCSPLRSLNDLRIRQAACELSETDRTIASIAHSCGFEDPLYFSRRFRQLLGCSPRRYRIKHALER